MQRLFGGNGAVAGRGTGRAAARRLLDGWRPSLRPVAADRCVAQILATAPFLWQARYGVAREALAAEHVGESGAVLWVAGPGGFRRRVLSAADDLSAAQRLLAGEQAGRLWGGPTAEKGPRALAAAGRYRAAAVAWETRPLPARGGAAERRERATAWLALGRFEAALAVLGASRGVEAGLLRARCQLHLSRLRSARRTVERLAARSLTPEQTVELARVATRLSALQMDGDRHRDGAARAVAATRRSAPGVRWRARLVAAGVAWDRGDLEAARSHLEASARLADDPDDGWRWAQIGALVEAAAGDSPAAARLLSEALRRGRRRLYRHQAAALWNDLGLPRALNGDLAGAERAFGHSLRLYRGCDGSRSLTLAETNLAEIRLRRGRLLGVREILERASAENEADGNLRGGAYDTTLWARYELLHGRPEEALASCRKALERLTAARLEDQRQELHLLAARALGWLGRPEQAAAELALVDDETLSALEPEERPAVLALAGDREGASRQAEALPPEAGRAQAIADLVPLWSAVLAGAAPDPEAWAPLVRLEPYRAARLVYDCEMLVPGCAPADWLRRAVASLRRIGAARPARRLEARDRGPWTAISSYLDRRPGEGEALAALFAGAGYPEARLTWFSDRDARILVAGAGGPQQLAAPLAGGTLELAAPVVDAALSALFRLALRDLPGPQDAGGRALPRASAAGRAPSGEGGPGGVAGSHGIVGRDPQLLAAVDRVERIAPGALPVLIQGESGTGKELIARRVHRASSRSEGPFVAINCAALSESLLLSELFGHARGAFTGADRDRVGIFETGQGGTVFLDEIGDLPPSAQGMLLRVLQEGEVRRVGETLPRPVDVRVVAASHRDLAAMAREGTFRQDLYYRLKGALVRLPPLRERGDDVLLLAEHLLAKLAAPARPLRLTAAARSRLLAHRWPGNVRELENSLGVATALASRGVIEPQHLELAPPAAGVEAAASSYHQQVNALKARLVEEALRAADGNQSQAARRLDLSRQAMSYLVRSLGIR